MKIMTLGENLLYYRKLHGYTQKELARMLETEQNTYAFYEWDRREPTLRHVLRLAKLYGVSVETLVGEEYQL